MLENLYKLEKLKIEAFTDVERKKPVSREPFEAMFNPESFNRKFGIDYGKDQGLNTSSKKMIYSRTEPEEFKIKLTLDGTGVNETKASQSAPGKTKKVSERVEELLDLTFRMNGDIHEPNYLKVTWGDLDFDCRLSNINVNYTNFDRSGNALRAELELSLISDEDPNKRKSKEKKSSPDLTHSRIVMAGDTLPLLTQKIYGSSAHYLWVAQFNQLDDFRNLTLGQRLYFPPLSQDTTVH